MNQVIRLSYRGKNAEAYDLEILFFKTPANLCDYQSVVDGVGHLAYSTRIHHSEQDIPPLVE